MSLPELGLITEFIRIPKIFKNSETGKPISHCTVCNQYLLEDGTPYMIEKAVKQYSTGVKDIVFEYALCIPCMMMFHEALSVESRQRIEAYFNKHVDFVKRRNELLKRKTLRITSWINRCVVKNIPVSKCSEYQLAAQFDGKHLLFTYMPYALSGEAMSDIVNLLSPQSRDEIDDFMGKHFSGPPEVAELIRNRSLVLI